MTLMHSLVRKHRILLSKSDFFSTQFQKPSIFSYFAISGATPRETNEIQRLTLALVVPLVVLVSMDL